MYALLGLAIVIAVLGITNTLALSVIERTVRSGCCVPSAWADDSSGAWCGWSRSRSAVLGALLGMVMGVTFGIVLQRAVADQGLDVLSIPWGRLGIFAVLSIVAGSLAAVFPARRAARLNVLDAITIE